MLLTSKRFHILLKDSTLDEVKQAYGDLQNNRQFANQKLLVWMEAEEKAEKSALTTTEKEILKAMSLGKTTKEIAAERYSSVSTPADFRFLAPIVLEQVLRKAGTQLLEPYLSFTIFTPQEYLSQTRRQ